MQVESVLLSAGITIFSLGLLIVSLISYRKHRNMRLLFISIILLTLLIKGMLFTVHVFLVEIPALETSVFNGVFDFIILLLLFIATVKR